MKVKRSRIPRMILGVALCLGMLGLAPLAALASSPLPTPTNLQAVHVADTSADLTWLSNGASAQDVLQVMASGAWHEYARGLFGSISLTGLTRATTYTFRVYSIPVQGPWLHHQRSLRTGDVHDPVRAGHRPPPVETARTDVQQQHHHHHHRDQRVLG